MRETFCHFFWKSSKCLGRENQTSRTRNKRQCITFIFASLSSQCCASNWICSASVDHQSKSNINAEFQQSTIEDQFTVRWISRSIEFLLKFFIVEKNECYLLQHQRISLQHRRKSFDWVKINPTTSRTMPHTSTMIAMKSHRIPVSLWVEKPSNASHFSFLFSFRVYSNI